jgi:acyl dehydratase
MTPLTTDGLGRLVDSYDVRVDPAQVIRYATAIGRAGIDDAVPPLFGVVIGRRATLAALRSVVPDSVSARMPVLHGEQDVVLHRPLRAHETVKVYSRALGVRQKSSGVLVQLGISVSSDDEPIEEQRFVVFLPGAEGVPDAGQDVPTLASVSPGPSTVRTTTGRDQSRAYAEASGDDTAFHVDDRAAREYGFSGVIMHGLCTLAAVVDDLAVGRAPRRVCARFASPAVPGEDVLTSFTATDGLVQFTSAAPDGRVLLDRGRVELR